MSHDRNLDAVPLLKAVVARIATDPHSARSDAAAVVRAFPNAPAALRVLALAERCAGNDAAADKHELEAIALALRQPALRDAQAAIAEGRLNDAEPLVRAHLRSDPEDPAGALMLGEIAFRCRAAREAENLMRRAFLLAPAYAEARLALARIQREEGRYADVLETLSGLLALDPAHQAGRSLEAAVLVQLHRYAQAEESFRKLLASHPRDARGHANFAFLLKTVGRQSEAVSAYRQAIAIDPQCAQAWWGLANLKTIRFSAADVETMRGALADDRISDDERIHFQFALGKALDDIARYEDAFAAYSAGARLRLAKTPHDPAKVFANVRKVGQVFSDEFFAKRAAWGCSATDPIFIVSLPRSGSTLVEQILASHPQVEGTEELFDIERIALEIAPQEQDLNYADAMAGLSLDTVRRIGESYIEATRRLRKTDRPFFTDKMPSNWVYVGLIHLILPNAKIIDVRRHPLGCGFANFSQHFNWGINFSYDLGHIGDFYSAYVQQMAHFDRVLPGVVHRVTYEALVEDTEAEVRRLLAYLGLPFDAACLRFHENRRAVHTPSSEQVRSPINREGMERWRRYDRWLGPLKAALGPILTHYPAVPPFSELD